MKNKINLILIAILLFACSACSKEDTDKTSEVELLVASKYETCQPSFTSTTSQHCIRITKRGQNDSYLLSETVIAGFTYEEGYNYILSVKQTKLANPAMDDIAVRYELIKILSKLKD